MKNKIQIEKVDLTNFQRLGKIIEKFRPDVIIHLAGNASHSKSFENPIHSVIFLIKLLKKSLISLETEAILHTPRGALGPRSQGSHFEDRSGYCSGWVSCGAPSHFPCSRAHVPQPGVRDQGFRPRHSDYNARFLTPRFGLQKSLVGAL